MEYRRPFLEHFFELEQLIEGLMHVFYSLILVKDEFLFIFDFTFNIIE